MNPLPCDVLDPLLPVATVAALVAVHALWVARRGVRIGPLGPAGWWATLALAGAVLLLRFPGGCPA